MFIPSELSTRLRCCFGIWTGCGSATRRVGRGGTRCGQWWSTFQGGGGPRCNGFGFMTVVVVVCVVWIFEIDIFRVHLVVGQGRQISDDDDHLGQ